MSEKPCGAYFFAFFENFFVPISTSGGYVGLSIATLLSQHHQVTAVDIVPEKVDLINNRKSPIQDDYIEKYLAEKELNLTATLDAKAAYADADFVVIAAPTNVYSKESVAIVLSVGAVLSEGFFVQNAEKNLRYKEEPILIFTTRTRLRLVVDLQENVRAQENLAYALKVKISNLQKMAETLVWVQEPFPYSTADVCFAAGPHDPFAEEQLGGCTGPGICALSAGRAGGRSSEQHFQCHPRSAGTGSCTADRTAVQWLFQAKPDISRRSPDCAEMHSRDGQK